jgi:hypothetical protein
MWVRMSVVVWWAVRLTGSLSRSLDPSLTGNPSVKGFLANVLFGERFSVSDMIGASSCTARFILISVISVISVISIPSIPFIPSITVVTG